QYSRRNAAKDPTLSDDGGVRKPSWKRRAVKAIAKQTRDTFQSNAGLDREITDTMRLHGYERAALTDALAFEARQIEDVLRKAGEKESVAEQNKIRRAVNDYFKGDTKAHLSAISVNGKLILDQMKDRINQLSDGINKKMQDRIGKLEAKLQTLNKNKETRKQRHKRVQIWFKAPQKGVNDNLLKITILKILSCA
ncbi:MAG: hypothetical protein Q4G08_06075, partial [Capnocytophaga sp.]|nr:hypothetical protein [Capnocytophaga sp.]